MVSLRRRTAYPGGGGSRPAATHTCRARAQVGRGARVGPTTDRVGDGVAVPAEPVVSALRGLEQAVGRPLPGSLY